MNSMLPNQEASGSSADGYRSPQPDAPPPEVHIAYCDYAATGEGRTVMVAVGYSASHAERVFRLGADPYFHPGVVVARLDSPDPEVRRMAQMIPPAVLSVLARQADGLPQYYGELHWNRS